MSLISNINDFNKNAPSIYAAQNLSSFQRYTIALKALSGQSITTISKESNVSRNFVYGLKDIAIDAINNAFGVEKKISEKVLFNIPVTEQLIKQFVIGLALTCHSSERGIVEFLRDFMDYKISVGTVHSILSQAALNAHKINENIDLSPIERSAHDEIFQGNKPILVGADTETTFTYVLSLEDSRDSTTWGLRFLDAKENGLNPKISIADGGNGLRAGQSEVFPDLPCDADVFHVLHDFGKIKNVLENRAIRCISKVYELEKKEERNKVRYNAMNEELLRIETKKNNTPKWSAKIGQLKASIANSIIQSNDFLAALEKVRPTETNALDSVDTIAIITRWMQYDILCKIGPSYAERCELFDFVTQILDTKAHQSHHIKTINTKLKNQRDDLLRFASRVDGELSIIAQNMDIPLSTVRSLYELQAISYEQTRHWDQEKKLREELCVRYYLVELEVKKVIKNTLRASSVIENLNSRLRPYFFLRKSFGQQSLDLLKFYLNHKKFMRSEHPGRIDKSPAELLSKKSHPIWIEMLGFNRFKQSVA